MSKFVRLKITGLLADIFADIATTLLQYPVQPIHKAPIRPNYDY